MDATLLKEKLAKVIALLKEQEGLDYGDIRVNHIEIETISTENEKLNGLTATTDLGYGVRVFVQGTLGFASSQDFEAMEQTALEAVDIARASLVALRNPVHLAVKPVVVDHYQTPIEIDPFSVSLEEKLGILTGAEKLMRQAAPELFRTSGFISCRVENKTFTDTEGSYITQTIYTTGGSISAIAAAHGEMQTRSYPNAHRGNHLTAGFEYIHELDFAGNAPRVGREAMELIAAEPCPSGYFDLVLSSSALILQLHESVGHPIELDRVLGSEAGLAGTSFLDSVEPGKFRYGSEHVNIVADATWPRGIGTYGYDDDGVAAQRVEVITEGIFKNFISSRESAPAVGQLSNGCNRAESWGRIPIVRMSNINLLPGKFTLDELIAGVEYGFFLDINRSWSIDDRRHSFNMAAEIAYEIKDGKLSGKIFKTPFYSGISPEFWATCDGVANEDFWRNLGLCDCAKGEPEQAATTGHGSSPARFRNVKVGVVDA